MIAKVELAMDDKTKKKPVKRLDDRPKDRRRRRYTAIMPEHYEKIRKFLKEQSAHTGRSIADLLSQSVTQREVSWQNIIFVVTVLTSIFEHPFSFQAARFNQLLFEQITHNPDPDKPYALTFPPLPQVVVKEERQDEGVRNDEVG